MPFCLPLLRPQISDYESDAPGGHCSLQLLAKCSSAHYVPQGANQRPTVEEARFYQREHRTDILKFFREVLQMSVCFFVSLFKNKPNSILEIVHTGIVKCHRMEKLRKAHLLAFPEPRIHSARHRLSFCLISLIRLLTWQAVKGSEAH